MKKTLSINISGILFHIEEDGYATLQNYLDGINRHFSEYPDSKEIVLDIENRIAEIFLSYLKNNKQVITAENVDRLIEKMGTIAAFSVVTEAPVEKDPEEATGDDFYKYVTPPDAPNAGYKKLMRLETKKILGGVCAGIAHYFAIDALWVRLIAILLLMSGNINFRPRFFEINPFEDYGLNFNFGFSAFAVLAYIVLWVILPVSQAVEEDKTIKKLFRNPDDKVLGGVASGLSGYFGIDTPYIRLAFVFLTIAGGSGVVIYLILWIITPAASSITERIKMKGGEITLDSIDSTVKETINPIPMEPESTLKKVLMTPFRVLGQVIEALGSALGSLGKFLLSVLRVLFGMWVLFLGIVPIGAALIGLAVYLGLIDSEYGPGSVAIPVGLITELAPIWLVIAGFGLIALPGLVLLLLGLSVLVKKSLIGSKIGGIILALWLFFVGMAAFHIPKIIAKFKEEARYELMTPISLTPGILLLRVNDLDDEEINNKVQLELVGTQDTVITLKQEYFSRGESKKEALANAKKIQYSYDVRDSVMTFEEGFDLRALDTFRDQDLTLRLAIPYDKPFIMERSLLQILENTIYKNGFEMDDVREEAIWVFNETGLVCLTCPGKVSGERRDWDSFETVQAKADSIAKVQKDSLSKAKFKDAYFLKEN
jgi:phage shock protein PspC (stress-responsive transcriptional regulator)